MTTIKRFTPDYKMHAVRFEAFAREAEHGEYVRFDAHQQKVSALEAERDALAVENAALKDSNRKLINEQQASWPIGLLDSFIDEHAPKTPATDAALAAIQARILPPNIAEIIDSGDLETICYGHEHPFAERIRLALYNFRQQREAK
ncbi:hypothetical protein [Serratia surfactantfaciens]|uniref:hypothetical protein n=1 Tax=Serratia surfactantfaciens TaxID=2741499 RepID=UPI001B3C4DF8|nr:hypothetical protein [Serratia surfactantfaciens]